MGLNKNEAYHALARTVHIGQGGVLKSRNIEDQANQITCLRLLITAIIVWNAVYMGKAVEWLRASKYEVADEQLNHIYPMFLDHLNLIGEYRFPREEHVKTRLESLSLRPLEEVLGQGKLAF